MRQSIQKNSKRPNRQVQADTAVKEERQTSNTAGCSVSRDSHNRKISDLRLHSRSLHSDSRVAWSACICWAEGKSVFVLFPEPQIYQPIPKRAFRDHHLEEFRDILTSNVGSRQNPLK